MQILKRISRVKESSIESDVAGRARKAGIESIKVVAAAENGWPDRIFLIPGGRPLIIEFKKPGEPLRPLQEHRVNCLRLIGYDVCVCEEREAACANIEECCRIAGWNINIP